MIMGLASPRPIWQVHRLEILAGIDVATLARRLETQAEFLCCYLNAEFLLLQGTLVSVFKAFSSLDEAHLCYGGPPTLLKVN